MIRYSVKVSELKALIKQLSLSWLDRALARTERFRQASKYDERSSIWSEIVGVKCSAVGTRNKLGVSGLYFFWRRPEEGDVLHSWKHLPPSGQPRFDNLLLTLPKFLHETAFIDRIHAILPGWELPRIQEPAISNSVGFKADFLGEVLHGLRHRAGYTEHISTHGQILGTQDVRDRNAITRLAAGYLKLLFPDLRLTHSELVEYCLRPAASLRQTVRDQLAIMDPEYKKVYIEVATRQNSLTNRNEAGSS
jgi:hypothetical protein